MVLTITDSRGYTASVTQNITVLAYAKPKVNSLTLRRTNDIEAEMQLVFNGSISAITVDSVQKNSLLYVRYRYKATSATSYSSYVSILSAVTQSGTSFSYSNLELGALLRINHGMSIQIRDQLNSLSSLDLYYVIPQVPAGSPTKAKVGINTPTPEAALDVVGRQGIRDAYSDDTFWTWHLQALTRCTDLQRWQRQPRRQLQNQFAVLPLAGGH